MAKKKTKDVINQKEIIKIEIIGIFIFVIAILTAISLYYNQDGFFMGFLKNGLLYMFGTSAYFFPVALGIYVFVVFKDHEKEVDYLKIIPIILFIVLIATYIYTGRVQSGTIPTSLNYTHDTSSIFENMSEGLSGRVLGSLLISIFGVFGTYVILTFLVAVYFVNVTKKSIIKIIRSSVKSGYISTKDMAQSVAIRIKESRVSNDDVSEEEKQKFLYGDKKNNKTKVHDIIIEKDDKSKRIVTNSEEGDIKIFGVDSKGEIVANAVEAIEIEERENIQIGFYEKSKKEKKIAVEKATEKEVEEIEVASCTDKISYRFPSISLLNRNPSMGNTDSRKELLENAEKLETTLDSFGVKAKVVQVNKGPTVTRYELQPSIGVKVSKIVNLADDIALNLAAVGVRIEAPIPGKAAIGIEIPNKLTIPVFLREVIDTVDFKQAESKVSVALGKDIAGKEVVVDLSKMPHLLIAGSTGSGKSVCINSIIASLIYKADPNEVKLLMIDPKVVELKMYNGIPHLMIPVVTEPKKAASALNWAVAEMLSRYKTFADNNVRDIKGYNKMLKEKKEDFIMPQIVIIIDELADLMMSTPKDVEDAICRLAQMARAAGMHLIIATQRPSVDVITGVIKANIPSRIAFAVSSNTDSRTILDMAGAEKLLGKGDMLYYPVGESKPKRIQGAFVSDKEIEKLVETIKKHGETEYKQEMIDEITSRNADNDDTVNDGEDELTDQAIELIMDKDRASISMFQRAFKIGYNRAARLMDQLEARGVVSADEGTKPRRVIRGG
ncbi:MAG: hypothetical protein A2Y24_00305 [Clostridiales bacterium GWE2_32_10]|nr:MAG: hypothetical protein A2Y24_00305 [Clostridiales bacterium GWE2_32_10]HBY20412.1 cell division protein FtsK [Clostridiales bacterium]